MEFFKRNSLISTKHIDIDVKQLHQVKINA